MTPTPLWPSLSFSLDEEEEEEGVAVVVEVVAESWAEGGEFEFLGDTLPVPLRYNKNRKYIKSMKKYWLWWK